MVIAQKNRSRTIQNIIGVALGLASSYLLLTAIVGMLFELKTPQPYYNQKPFNTYLSDPNAKQAYKKVVKPAEIQTLLDRHPYAY